MSSFVAPVGFVRKWQQFPSLREFGVAAEEFRGYTDPMPSLHMVDVTLLTVILDGHGRHVIDGIEHEIHGPSFAVTHKGETHSLATDKSTLDVVNVYLDLDRHPVERVATELDRALATLFPLGRSSTQRLPQVALPEISTIRGITGLLVRETHKKRIGNGPALVALRELLLIECSRALAEHGFLVTASASSRTEIAVDTIRSHLDRTFTEPQTLATLAEMANLDPAYLSRAFSTRTGETITRYVARLRIGLAMQQLRFTDVKVAQIAHSVGFNDISHFGRVFRREVGTSPSEYRRTGRAPVATRPQDGSQRRRPRPGH